MTSQEAINARFVEAVNKIVAESHSNGGPYTSRTSVATSIGLNQSNLPHRPNRNASATACANLCQVHGVNPAWLLLGTGEIFLNEELAAKDRIAAIEKRLQELEKKNTA